MPHFFVNVIATIRVAAAVSIHQLGHPRAEARGFTVQVRGSGCGKTKPKPLPSMRVWVIITLKSVTDFGASDSHQECRTG